MEDLYEDAPRPEELVEEVLPEDLPWADLVRRYPAPALALAAVGGFVIGLRHGPAVLAAVGTLASRRLSRFASDLVSQGFEGGE